MSETPVDRTPPQDLHAEQSVLGAMLLSREAITEVTGIIRAADFYRPAHTAIFAAILDLHHRAEPADPVTVKNELETSGELARIGGAPYLLTLIESVPTAANAGYYAGIVRDRALLRRTIAAGTRIVQLGYTIGSGEEAIAYAQTELAMAEAEAMANADIPGFAPLEEFLSAQATQVPWVIPGLIGIQERWLILAVEGAGKSVLARQLALSLAAGVHPLWSTVPIPAKRSLVIDLENPEHLLRKDFKRQSEGLLASPNGNIWVWHKPGGVDLANPAHRREFDAVLVGADPSLVCLSPVYKAHRYHENWEKAVAPVTEAIDAARDRHPECAFWIEHHANKGGRVGNNLDALGSSVWNRWPDFVVSLTAEGAPPFPALDWNVQKARDYDRDYPTQIRRDQHRPGWTGWFEDGAPAWMRERRAVS